MHCPLLRVRWMREIQSKIVCLVGACVVAIAASGNAQQLPQRTTATYGDWTVQCEVKAGPPTQKICQISQSARAQNQPNPISMIAIGRPTTGASLKLVIQVPINVWLPAGVKLVPNASEPGMDFVYKRCIPAACFTDID